MDAVKESQAEIRYKCMDCGKIMTKSEVVPGPFCLYCGKKHVVEIGPRVCYQCYHRWEGAAYERCPSCGSGLTSRE